MLKELALVQTLHRK